MTKLEKDFVFTDHNWISWWNSIWWDCILFTIYKLRKIYLNDNLVTQRLIPNTNKTFFLIHDLLKKKTETGLEYKTTMEACELYDQ